MEEIDHNLALDAVGTWHLLSKAVLRYSIESPLLLTGLQSGDGRLNTSGSQICHSAESQGIEEIRA